MAADADRQPRGWRAVVLEQIGPPRLPPPPELAVSRYIPLSRRDVIADLCHDPTGAKDVDAFALMGVRLQRHRGDEYDRRAARIGELYLPFSPDPDSVVVGRADRKGREEHMALSAEIDALLTQANFRVVPNETITDILSRQSPYALQIEVDLSEYDVLQVYSRDEAVERRSVRRPERAYLVKAHFEVRIFRRLFVMLKLKSDEDKALELAEAEAISYRSALRRVRRRRRGLPEGTNTDEIHVKVFKDMPEHDLQILFPLRRVQFRPFDKLKFMATAGGGTVVGIFSTTGKLLAATNPVTAVVALVAFIGLVGRQVATFFNQRNQYMMELAQKLFFHNLANNRAAITLLLDRAEEEDVKEDLITMYFCAGTTFEAREVAARKRAIDALIAARYGVAVDFEIEDALSRLVADGAVARDGDTYRVMSFADAAQRYAELLRADDASEAHGLAHRDEVSAPDGRQGFASGADLS